MIPWQQAWQDALYGPAGFYRSPEGPAGHFTTSTHPPLGAVFARAIAALADREDTGMVVDFACGRGELLRALHVVRPDLELVGVDVVDRPKDLPSGIEWIRAAGGSAVPDALAGLADVLVLANEWLDVVPCQIAQVDDAGVLRVVLVDPRSGRESLGDEVDREAREWADRWWRTEAPGDRVEVGISRDRAWAGLVEAVGTGTVVAIDFGHTAGDRPTEGTLAAYRLGVPVPTVPDASCDLTAHVAMDSLPGATLQSQHDALLSLGLAVEHPPVELAHSDPARYLADLSRRGAVAQLTDPTGLGAFRWAQIRIG